jgi:hypothetical protein
MVEAKVIYLWNFQLNGTNLHLLVTTASETPSFLWENARNLQYLSCCALYVMYISLVLSLTKMKKI